VIGAIGALPFGCKQPELTPTPSFCAAAGVASIRSFVAPPLNTGECTAAQLAAYRAACFEPSTATQTECSAWSRANSGCFGCTFSSQNDSRWGALVAVEQPSEITFANIGGCVAAVSPKDQACGAAIQADLACMIASCQACAVDTTTDYTMRQAQVDVLNACYDSAQSGPCSAYAAAASSCQPRLESNVLATCENSNGTLDGLFAVMSTMCGGG
jgi:hypothetical protein